MTSHIVRIKIWKSDGGTLPPYSPSECAKKLLDALVERLGKHRSVDFDQFSAVCDALRKTITYTGDDRSLSPRALNEAKMLGLADVLDEFGVAVEVVYAAHAAMKDIARARRSGTVDWAIDIVYDAASPHRFRYCPDRDVCISNVADARRVVAENMPLLKVAEKATKDGYLVEVDLDGNRFDLPKITGDMIKANRGRGKKVTVRGRLINYVKKSGTVPFIVAGLTNDEGDWALFRPKLLTLICAGSDADEVMLTLCNHCSINPVLTAAQRWEILDVQTVLLQPLMIAPQNTGDFFK